MQARIPRIVLWLLTFAWAAVIFYLSSRPGSTLPGGWSVQGHLGEYFVLGVLLYQAISDRAVDSTTVALVVVLASLYGVTDEFHQQFVPMRTPDVADWMLDTIGAAAGALMMRAYALHRMRRVGAAVDGRPRED